MDRFSGAQGARASDHLLGRSPEKANGIAFKIHMMADGFFFKTGMHFDRLNSLVSFLR
jgi:hypothetical protein